jgi:hypothetical protein
MCRVRFDFEKERIRKQMARKRRLRHFTSRFKKGGSTGSKNFAKRNLLLVSRICAHRENPCVVIASERLPIVMPGLVPGIHIFLFLLAPKTWMAGSSPAMTIAID